MATPDRTARERQIFEQALDLASAEERLRFLEGACGDDAVLLKRVQDLLRADEAGEDFLPDQPRDQAAGALVTEKPGDRIGRYKLIERIGEGGCGVVYLAEQEEPIRRRVALKVIKLGMDTRAVVARFEAERQALALMDHPNIAKVFDAGATEAGRPFFVMELVRGVRITDYCDQKNLCPRERLDLFIQVCRAIQHAHQKGIIHRDIKPSNILVTLQDGVPVPKVIDFGIAKATTQQRLTDKTAYTAFERSIGTPAYMSPEQAGLKGWDIDTRSDIYSLGVLLYELLAGKSPFDTKELLAAGLDEMRRTIREKEPVRPSTRLTQELSAAAASRKSAADPPGQDGGALPRRRYEQLQALIRLLRGDLDWIVMKCLEKDRERRYGTANDLALDLQRHLNNEPVMARPPSSLYRFQKLVRRKKLPFAAAAAVAVALALGLLGTVWQGVRATHAERRQRMTLAASDLAEAERLVAQGERGDALAYLVRSLTSNPANDAALTRLTTLLSYNSWMIPAVILKHDAEVGYAEFSRDGTRIATASRDCTARVWNAQSGQPLMPPLKDAGGGASAQFSPDGARVVTVLGGDVGAVRVWDARNGEALTRPMEHSRVRFARFSPDGSHIITAADDGSVRVWNLGTSQPVTGPLNHVNGEVFSAQFSPDGERILTAGADKTAREWYAQSGKPVIEPLAHRNWVHDAQFSPDGKWIATASYDNSARIWDALTGLPRTGPMEHDDAVLYVQFSPDGKRIVTGCMDSTARVWDAQTGQAVTGPLRHNGQVVSVQFSPDGTRILTGSFDGTARLWDARTGQPLSEPLKHGGRVLRARFGPDGSRILTASGDGKARVWLALSSPALPEILAHGSNVVSAHFSPDGKQVLTASYDSSARLWDARTGKALTAPLRHAGPVLSAQFGPGGKRVVTSSADATARLWDARSGKPLASPMKHAGPVLSAQFNPDGSEIVTASQDGTARVWDATSGRALTEPLNHGDQVLVAQFSPDGRCIVTGSWDDSACVWEAQSGRRLARLLQDGSGARSAQFSPDGRKVLTVSRSGETASIWDVVAGRRLGAPLKHSDAVWSAQFDPQGRRVVTASMDYTAVIWDMLTHTPLTEPMQHRGGVTWAAFSRDGWRVATASKDCTARVWDAGSGRPLTDPFLHRDVVRTSEFSPDGKRVLTASDDGNARLWDVAPAQAKRPDWLLQLAEAVSGQVLNSQSVLEPTKLNRAEVLNGIRYRLKHEPDGDDWAAWGGWFLANASMRTISPFSKVTVPEYVDRLLEAPTAQALAEAESLAFGSPELLQRIAVARQRLKPTRPSEGN